jgi:hypothetical protein
VGPFSGVHALLVVSVFSSSFALTFNCNCFFFKSDNSDMLSRSFCLQDHQTLLSHPQLPEGGDVSERAVITDDSQETSVRESEPAESDKSAGSSDKPSESGQASGSSRSNSPPSSASPDKRKRKRNPDEENSSESKLSEPAGVESTPERQENFDPFAAAGDVSS